MSFDILHQHTNTLPSGFKVTFTVGRIVKHNPNSLPISSPAADKPEAAADASGTHIESDGPKSRPEAAAKSAAHIDTPATGKASAQERSSDRSGGQFGDAPKPAHIPSEVAQ